MFYDDFDREEESIRMFDAFEKYLLVHKAVDYEIFRDDSFGQRAESSVSSESPRVLLDVEKRRRARAEAEEARVRKRKDAVQRDLDKMTFTHTFACLKNYTHASRLLRTPANMSVMYSQMYSDETSAADIVRVLKNDKVTIANMLELARDDKIKARLGININIDSKTDIKTFIGLIGVSSTLRTLYPYAWMMSSIRSKDSDYPLLKQKLWWYAIAYGRTLTDMLRDEGCTYPEYGHLVAVKTAMARMVIYMQYRRSFETVKTKMLNEESKTGDVVRYSDIMETDYNTVLIYSMFKRMGATLSYEMLVASSIDVPDALLNGMQEDSEKIDTPARSDLGQLIRRASAYARFRMLLKAKLFPKQYIRSYADDNCLTLKQLGELYHKYSV